MSIANTTAPASGVNRYFAAPVRSSTGTNTTQIESVDTNAGTAICEAPSRIALVSGFFMPRLRWMFSTSTVASSTRMPTASARPPSVITLIVCPNRLRTISEVRIESGIEMQTISVERQLPRNSRIIRPVRPAAIAASRTTPLIAALTNTDWSNSWRTSSEPGSPAVACLSLALMPSTMSSVDASPWRRIGSSEAWLPSFLTMLVCTAWPCRTCATSRM